MLTPFGPEPVAEPEEICLVDGVQHSSGRSLDDFVLKCRHSHIELHFDPVSLWVRLR
jgi:hypothetical protein